MFEPSNTLPLPPPPPPPPPVIDTRSDEIIEEPNHSRLYRIYAHRPLSTKPTPIIPGAVPEWARDLPEVPPHPRAIYWSLADLDLEPISDRDTDRDTLNTSDQAPPGT
jgi:hypothetical protein